jgi:UDP-N-acetylglucosamine 2-epimerase (non-hydrolysing)
MHIAHVVGARPNLIKVAPVMRSLERAGGLTQTLVHTGQHYDDPLSGRFLRDLDIPNPSVNLGVGSSSHAEQTGRIMIALEPELERRRPDWVFTVGDVNSTVAAALVAAKLGIPVAHVEAGLRSFDRSMPEEINRVVTDRLSDALFTTEPSANENLRREGIDGALVHHVGNVMIDTLDRYRAQAAGLAMHEQLSLGERDYVLVTLHRPQNVDREARLRSILEALNEIGAHVPLVMPLHPRTESRVRAFGLDDLLSKVKILGPLGYLEFLGLMIDAGVVLTDSGGVQEETSVLGVPCVTLRPNTERPITLEEGTNRLFDGDLGALPDLVLESVTAERRPCRPALWDGKAADRIAEITRTQLAGSR